MIVAELIIIAIILNVIATGVLFYFNKQLKRKLENNNRALLVLHKEFTQYQVSEKRSHEKETAKMEIRHDHIAKSIKKNEDAIYGVNKTLPEKIRKVIGHIEFARPLDKK